MRVIVNPDPPAALPKLRLSADIVSPTLYPVPSATIVTEVTEFPETTIVAFPPIPDPLVVRGTFAYVPFA